MKLRTPLWKGAWYEEGLSDRFSQEMTRLERTVVKDIGTSAQWVEQLVIELGLLTQNMIHLEGEAPPGHQLRLAFEKALKLSALAGHLMAALDLAADKGPAVLRYSEVEADAGPAGSKDAGAAHAPGLRPLEPQWPAAEPPWVKAPAAQPLAYPVPRSAPEAQVGLKRQSMPASTQPPAAPPPPPSFAGGLFEISESLVPAGPNPMREMILSLSRRGLSRSEIEVITEQPRHIIEAVLEAG
jgi:hypothetical protein